MATLQSSLVQRSESHTNQKHTNQKYTKKQHTIFFQIFSKSFAFLRFGCFFYGSNPSVPEPKVWTQTSTYQTSKLRPNSKKLDLIQLLLCLRGDTWTNVKAFTFAAMSRFAFTFSFHLNVFFDRFPASECSLPPLISPSDFATTSEILKSKLHFLTFRLLPVVLDVVLDVRVCLYVFLAFFCFMFGHVFSGVSGDRCQKHNF